MKFSNSDLNYRTSLAASIQHKYFRDYMCLWITTQYLTLCIIFFPFNILMMYEADYEDSYLCLWLLFLKPDVQLNSKTLRGGVRICAIGSLICTLQRETTVSLLPHRTSRSWTWSVLIRPTWEIFRN